MPSYLLFVGGRLGLDRAQLGSVIGKYPAKNGIKVLETLLSLLQSERRDGEDFTARFALQTFVAEMRAGGVAAKATIGNNLDFGKQSSQRADGSTSEADHAGWRRHPEGLDCGSPLPLFCGFRLATDTFNRTHWAAQLHRNGISTRSRQRFRKVL